MTNKVKLTLISSYPKLKMLSSVGKLEFDDGVCVVEFNTKEDAEKFASQIEVNRALGAYVKVARKGEEKVVAQAHIDAAKSTGVTQGVQTSEAKETPEAKAKANASPATIFSLPKKEA